MKDRERKKELIKSLRLHEAQCLNLMELLDTYEYETLGLMAGTDEPIEIYRLQGKCKFISEFRKTLTRKPVNNELTGGFS